MKLCMVAVLLFFSLSSYASTEFVWGIRSQLDEYDLIANKFKKDIEEKTKGEILVTIKKFEDDPKNPVKEIEDGSLQILQTPTQLLSSTLDRKEVDWANVWNIPYLFKNKHHVEKYILSENSQQRLTSLSTKGSLALTYSYAGGFLSVVTLKDQKIENIDNLAFCNIAEFQKKPISGPEERKFLSELPCNALNYDLNVLTKFSEEIKKQIKVGYINYKVFSRVTLISKKHLEKISVQNKQYFLSRLNSLLAEERQKVYETADKKLEFLKQDRFVEYHQLLEIDRAIASEDSIKKNSYSDNLKKEIKFIQSLVK